MFEREPQPSVLFVEHLKEIKQQCENHPVLKQKYNEMVEAFSDVKGSIHDRLLHPENSEFLDEKIKKRNNKLQRTYIELDQAYVFQGGPSVRVSPDNIFRFLTVYEGEMLKKAMDINSARIEARKEARREILERIAELSDQGLTKQEVLSKIVAELEAKNQE